MENFGLNYLKDSRFNEFLDSIPTPAMIYNLELLINWAQYLNYTAMEKNILLGYSLKANYNKKILKCLKPYVDFVDCASINEFKIATSLDFKKISCTSPGLSKENINFIIKNNGEISIDSIDQLTYISKLHPKKRVSIRINNGNNGIGIEIEELKNFLINNKYVKVSGLHFHNDSLPNIKKIIIGLKNVLNLNSIDSINFGGGSLPIDILLKDSQEIQSHILSIRNLTPNANLKVEPGQALVMTSGVLVSSILWRKKGCLVMDTSFFNNSSWYTPVPFPFFSLKKKIKALKILGNTSCPGDECKFKVDSEYVEGKEKLMFVMAGAYYTTTKRELHGYSFPKEYYYKDQKIAGIKNREKN
ncbi:pyridoxal-dependent decarboxylase [Enterococcus faecalis]|uniref:pyridoxal-dependent decarboxylase n=1 Tax=Enterococcus faecalis TaxID=1351 RepID=UPI00338D5462